MSAGGGSADDIRRQEICYEFDDLIVCAYTRQVLRCGEPVDIEKRPFDALLYLIRHRGKAVSKNELEQAVWKGRVVSETVVASCIMKVRAALGDDGERQRYVRTVRGFGYQFCSAVSESHSPLAPSSSTDTPPAGSLAPGDSVAFGRFKNWLGGYPRAGVMSALLVLAGLAVVIVVGMNRGWLPGEQAKMMLAVQPVQSAPENTALANRLTLIIDRMLSQAPDFHYMPTIDAFYDMESGFLPKDCLVLESWLSRNQDNYSLRYQLTVPNGEHLTGELAGINPQGLASQMSKNLGHWADLNQSSLASSP